ncbi:MAG: hypothetical protein IK013_04255 [Bacteroidales bacterium]|nr:hypothetical protein [Bacteroidales bacterium]
MPAYLADTHKMPAHLRRACVPVCRLCYRALQTYGLHPIGPTSCCSLSPAPCPLDVHLLCKRKRL